MDPNAELVQRAIVREPDAVRAFVQSFGPVVHERIAKALARRRDRVSQLPDLAQEVEHLAQEVFLALFDNGARALRAWDPARGTLGAFVVLVADHQIYSVLRSGKRRPWTDDIDILTASSGATATETPDALLDRLRADLSAKGFDIFARLHVEQRSIATVSAELHMSADAIAAWQERLAKVVQPLTLDQLGVRAREQNAEPASLDRASGDAAHALGAAAEERIAGRLLERVRDSLTHDLAAPRASRPGAASRSPRWLLAAGAALLAVAAVVLFVMTRGSPAIVATPAYELTLVSVNGVREPASAKVTATDFVLDPDGELELLARPVVPVKDAHARAFLVHAGDVKPWLVPLLVSDEGAVRITGMTRLLFPTTSEPYDVVLFVAGGDVLPSDAAARGIASGAEAPSMASYRVVRGHVRFAAAK